MKKFFSFLLTLIFLFNLSACNNSEITPEITPETTSATEAPVIQELDMETVYQNILTTIDAGEDIVMFSESNPDVINEFYEGISDIELKQQLLYIHPITGFACEIMLVEVANEADVEKAVSIFESRIALGSDDSCYAETAALWKSNAQVQSYGNYVCLIALPEGYEIPANVFVN